MSNPKNESIIKVRNKVLEALYTILEEDKTISAIELLAGLSLSTEELLKSTIELNKADEKKIREFAGAIKNSVWQEGTSVVTMVGGSIVSIPTSSSKPN